MFQEPPHDFLHVARIGRQRAHDQVRKSSMRLERPLRYGLAIRRDVRK
jgi:hypothetical protein